MQLLLCPFSRKVRPCCSLESRTRSLTGFEPPSYILTIGPSMDPVLRPNWIRVRSQCSHRMKQPCRHIRGSYRWSDGGTFSNELLGRIRSGFGQDPGKVSSEPGVAEPSCTTTALVRCPGKQEMSASSDVDFLHKTTHANEPRCLVQFVGVAV